MGFWVKRMSATRECFQPGGFKSNRHQPPRFPSKSDANKNLDFYKTLLSLRKIQISSAIVFQLFSEDYNIIETDILRTTAVKYHENSALTINGFVAQVKHSGNGMKLNIDADYDPIKALTVVERYKINAPVIVSVPYPGDSSHPSNLSR